MRPRCLCVWARAQGRFHEVRARFERDMAALREEKAQLQAERTQLLQARSAVFSPPSVSPTLAGALQVASSPQLAPQHSHSCTLQPIKEVCRVSV